MTADRLLKIPEVQQLLGLGRTALYNHIREGDLPKPIKIGNASRWRMSDLQAWIARGQA